MVRLLIDAKGDVNAAHAGAPALTLAAAAGCEGTVGDLLARGAAIDAVNEEGTTALMEAAVRGLTSIVQALLARGADLEIRNKAGQNAWLMAAMSGHQDVIEILRKVREKNMPKQCQWQPRPTRTLTAA
jgi:ankyrin repeat protein